MSAFLARIAIFPIKSLDSVVLDDVEVLAGGALAGDRRFALVDRDGRFINGKRTPAVHLVRAEYDLHTMHVRLRRAGDQSPAQFSLVDQRNELAEWLTGALGIACCVVEDVARGFPDDTDAPGPTVMCTATLRTVAGWFAGLTLDEARRRFRANLEVDGVEPFWEDRLVGPAESEVPFRIGTLDWLGVKTCQRCVVPTRSSQSAEVTLGFQKTFAAERERTLPEWATPERFDHFYRLAVNTRLAFGQPAILRRGDMVSISGGACPADAPSNLGR